MKKMYSFSIALLMLLATTGFSQSYQMQKTITDPDLGRIVQTEAVTKLPAVDNSFLVGGDSRAPGINWQFTDPASIGSSVKVSKDEELTYVAWWLNNIRASLYGTTSAPVWETPVTADFEFPIDMTPNGAFVVVGFSNLVRVYATATQALVWEKTTVGSVTYVKINADGSQVFVVENAPAGQDKASVSAYNVGVNDPIWSSDFIGTGAAFAISGDCSKLAFCQYPGANKMWILDGTNGDIIFDAFYRNQNPPAFSHDGKVIISGDYGGYAYLHEFDENTGSYYEKWSFKVGGGGTSAWVIGVDVSADGSTVAVGTLVFLASEFDGEIYLFNTYSNTPLWVFEHTGDEISSISMSADGSLIAAAGWGPLNHAKPDFFLFRKESNIPLFTLTTPGSFNSVDLSPDGTYCSVTGKAVHARVMGSGGLLYNINADPGGGTIAGIVSLTGATTSENVKIQVQGIEDYYGYSNDDGTYNIKYIPAGNYTVTASKVGYYPVEQTGVSVTEGGTANLNFTLTPTGNPPTALYATHGAGYNVVLNWAHANPGGTSGFNIYRKTIPEALFPETPIATVGNTELEFQDTDVKPLLTYYYAVTAILDQGAQSPYSNVADGWMASGFVVNEISAYTGSTPTIDGTLSAGEWDDAFSMDASDFLGTYDNNPNPVGSVTMFFKVNAQMTELYIACMDQNKPVLLDNFTVALYIDDNNDGTFPPSGNDAEGNYWARYFAAGNVITYRPIYDNGGVGQNLNLTNPQVAASDATGYVVMELVIPMGDDEVWKLNPNTLDQSGLFMFTTGFDGYWPALNQQIFYPLTYGTITFGAEDEVPPAPDALSIHWNSPTAPVLINMEWNQPAINDFDHFNVYINEGTSFGFLAETIGTQLFYLTENTDYTLFYVTTVDKTGQESEPSQNMIFDVTTGVVELLPANQLRVWPNPTSGDATISFVVETPGVYTISIFDLGGRLVKNIHQSQLERGDYVFRWNGTDGNGAQQKAGVYMVKISGNSQSIIEKIIRLN